MGSRVRGYTVERALDAPGGWHELVATDGSGRRVLLRVPADVDGAERIRGEAALARKHKNDGLLQSTDLIEHNGWPIQVLAFVDGMTLEALNVAVGALPPEAVCRVGRQLGLALVELHERAGVAHGALSAERVLIDTAGNARLVDVGCARPAGPRRLQSPERRRAVGPASPLDDLWALGMLLADAALGGALEASDSTPAALARSALPEKLRDALCVLVAPMGARLTNAAAAVRIFSEVEHKLGDGTQALRAAVLEARNTHKAPEDTTTYAPRTLPDGDKPFAALLGEAGAPDPEHPITQENTDPSSPRTIELTPERVLDVKQMQTMSALAEEAARRQSAGGTPEPSAALEAPGAIGIHDADTRKQPRHPGFVEDTARLTTPAVLRRPEPKPEGKSAAPPERRPEARPQAAPAAGPISLDEDELRAVGTPRATKWVAALVLLAIVALVTWMLLPR